MKYFFLIVLITLFVSCKKGKADFLLTGTVNDLSFNQKLVGASVKFYQVPVGSAQQVLIGTSTVGNDGAYSFTFPRDKMEKYILKITKNNYFDINETIYFSTLSVNDENVKDVATTAKSWAKLTFFNSNSVSSDHLRYIKQAGKEGLNCCSDLEQNYYGALDTSIYCLNDANTEYSYYYWVLGTSNQGLKSVITSTFDTTEIILNY